MVSCGKYDGSVKSWKTAEAQPFSTVAGKHVRQSLAELTSGVVIHCGVKSSELGVLNRLDPKKQGAM